MAEIILLTLGAGALGTYMGSKERTQYFDLSGFVGLLIAGIGFLVGTFLWVIRLVAVRVSPKTMTPANVVRMETLTLILIGAMVGMRVPGRTLTDRMITIAIDSALGWCLACVLYRGLKCHHT